MEMLVFHLHGPLASWGDIAVGEVRPSFPAPTRSALLGFIAACLGISRDSKDLLATLSESLSFAVRIDAEGSLLDEYQTVSLPRGRGHENAPTRRVEEQYSTDNTIQTYRAHYTDATYTVFVKSTHAKELSIEALERALKRPHFAPYLGRKANPVDLPLCPRLVKCRDLGDALRTDESELPDFIHELFKGTSVRPVRSSTGRPRRVIADARFEHWPWQAEEQRNNEPDSRTAWNFSSNLVRIGFDIEADSGGA